MTTVVIEQPNYLPWIGYFDLIRRSDVWIWYDEVQYTKRDWRNRNRIAAGEAMEWLTVPVKTKGRFTQAIADVEIDYSDAWMRRHIETLRRCYARAPFFDAIREVVERALAARPRFLADLTIRLNEAICSLLAIAPKFLRSSILPRSESDRQQRLLDLCRRVSATVYLSGPAARAYIDPAAFLAAGIELRYIRYDYPPYPRGPHPFVPNLSIVDALAWLGAEGTAAFLARQSRSEREVVTC
jgi:hypothetical protein